MKDNTSFITPTGTVQESDLAEIVARHREVTLAELESCNREREQQQQARRALGQRFVAVEAKLRLLKEIEADLEKGKSALAEQSPALDDALESQIPEQWKGQLLAATECAATRPASFSPGLPFTFGSLVSSGIIASSGALGPFPVWMTSNPCYPLGSVGFMATNPPVPSEAQTTARSLDLLVSRTPAIIAEDCA